MDVKLKRSALEERLAELENALYKAKEPSAINSYKKAIRNIKRLLKDCPEPPKKEYSVKTKFVFEGTFTVKANDKEQAREYVEKHCGLVLGGDIHTSLPDEIIDWNFSVHPQKIVR
jgi:hypothetical protein|nr:MAG TPA_asm: hypothetical protein [Caudoviricetes sp.]